MVDKGIADTMNWGVGTMMGIGMAGMAMKAMGGMMPKQARRRKRKR